MVKVLWVFILSCYLSQGALANQALESIQALEGQKESVVIQKATETLDTYVLSFFYMGSCSHCHRFAPVLEHYAHDTGIKVQSFTLDGGLIEGFEDAVKPDVELKESFFPDHSIKTPALFMVDVKRGEIYIVAIGALSEVELKARMESLQRTLANQGRAL